MAKTSILVIGKVDHLVELSQAMGCVVEQLPCRYLGIPLSSIYRNKKVWEPVIDSIQRRLGGWLWKHSSHLLHPIFYRTRKTDRKDHAKTAYAQNALCYWRLQKIFVQLA
ncbi:hypothetical protein IFM89_001475 [Coptis chinensis]|uniref:Uncharacterized protein n=1 Tax=Coptis chinensis TaxID=261450 RepID=A0A835GTP6_9MAGN|nr:hypothetical protein IFM89_001475 [Coptis chinensis]